MNKLSKAQIVTRDTLCKALHETYEDLEDAIAKFTDAMETAWDAVQVAMDAHNQAIADTREFQQEIAQAIEEFIDDKSDKWREGDRGQAYSAWLDAWNEELEDIDLAMPDGIEIDAGDQSDTLEQMPEEVDIP